MTVSLSASNFTQKLLNQWRIWDFWGGSHSLSFFFY